MTTTATGVPNALLAGAAQAADRLLAGLDRLDDTAARAASGLSGWSRGHVLTHLARHADSLRRTTEAAQRGDIIEPYDGGPAGRAAEIDAGAERGAAELVADIRDSTQRLAETWRDLDPSLWQAPTLALTGTRPLAMGVASRWLELEVHHVDLALGYGPADWPQSFVAAALPIIVVSLPSRARPDTSIPGSTWLVRCTDIGLGWTIDTTTVPAAVRPPAADGPVAGYVVEGPGHAMLAWLLGRSDGDDLTVAGTGDRSAVLALPSHYPFP